MKAMPARFAGFSEPGVLGQESVAGMDGFGTGQARDFENAFLVQVTFGRGRAAEAIRGVRRAHMWRIRVDVGIQGDGFEAHRLDGAQDAAGDRAAIGDQDFSEHCAEPPIFCFLGLRQVVPA